VAEWRGSGLTVKDFAASRGVPAGRLSWWQWHFALEEGSVTPAPPSGLRLVPVDVAPPASAPTPSLPIPSAPAVPAWELTTARGDVLRVYQAADRATLDAALSAMLSRGDRE
jgi:hypothetical protein